VTPKKKGRSRSLCRGTPPADDTSESESKPLKPVTRATSKPKASRCSCGPGARRRGERFLNFPGWKRWIAASKLLPEGFAAVGADEEGEAEAVKEKPTEAGRTCESLSSGKTRTRSYADDDDDDDDDGDDDGFDQTRRYQAEVIDADEAVFAR